MLPSQRDRTRRYRTRQDPFAEVWRAELAPMLAAMPSLRATTLLEELQRRHPARYPDRILRTLQRRIAQAGGRPRARNARSSFVRTIRLAIQVAVAILPSHGRVRCDHRRRCLRSPGCFISGLAFFGLAARQGDMKEDESFTALTEGMQEALWQLGGVPSVHDRTDRLSATYRNLESSGTTRRAS